MKPARLLLYGGTFDPPHVGHLNNLRAAIQAVGPDKVVVMPAGTPPHKAASATPGAVRLAMCRCFAAIDPRIEVSGWEIEQGGRSYTVHTLEMLQDRWPGAQLFLAVGSDMLLGFTAWHSWQRILQLAVLVVQRRAAAEDEPALQAAARHLRAAGGRVVFAAATPVPCASSQIRAGALPPRTLRGVLPLPVRRIICEQNLYGLAAQLCETCE